MEGILNASGNYANEMDMCKPMFFQRYGEGGGVLGIYVPTYRYKQEGYVIDCTFKDYCLEPVKSWHGKHFLIKGVTLAEETAIKAIADGVVSGVYAMEIIGDLVTTYLLQNPDPHPLVKEVIFSAWRKTQILMAALETK